MGVVLAARSTTLNYLLEPLVAEAMAALHAVELGRELSFFFFFIYNYGGECLTNFHCGQHGG